MKAKFSAVSLSVKTLSVDDFEILISSLLSEAHLEGAEILLFPEYTFAPLLESYKGNIFQASIKTDEIITKYATLKKVKCVWCGVRKYSSGLSNIALYFDGNIIKEQLKINLIESEKFANFVGGDKVYVFNSSFGKFAILICYDIEFPELTRFLKQHDVKLILVPSYTVDKFGANRVATCSSARAIENHIYVLTSCLIGNKGYVSETPKGRGFSALYSPCDIIFNSYTGILAHSKTDSNTNIIHCTIDFDILENLITKCSTSPYNDYLVLKNTTIEIEEI